MIIVATQDIIYQNRIFKSGEALPCGDNIMVKSWIESGAAKDIDIKEQVKTAPIIKEAPQEEKQEAKQEARKEETKKENKKKKR